MKGLSVLLLLSLYFYPTYLQNTTTDAGCMPTMHTCTNCEVFSLYSGTSYAHFDNVNNGSECEVTCRNDVSCKLAVFNVTTRQCKLYSCKWLHPNPISDTLAYISVETCTPGCTMFSLQRYDNFQINCDVIDTSIAENFLGGCIYTCLQRDYCTAVTFDSSNISCLYHSCDNTRVTWTSAMNTCNAAQRTCLVDSGCHREHVQQCVNCKLTSLCPTPHILVNNVSNSQLCINLAAWSDQTVNSSVYKEVERRCDFHYCGKVLVSNETLDVPRIFRKSCRNDCPVFSLAIQSERIGSCDPLEYVPYPHGNQADCIELCLDTPNCTFVSILKTDGICFLFNQTCNSFVGNSSYSTVNVTCIDPACPREQVQQCINCKLSSTCLLPHIIVNNVNNSQFCKNLAAWTDPTVFSIVYLEKEQRCDFHFCGNVMMSNITFGVPPVFRKSCRKDCPVFSLDMESNKIGTCDPLAYVPYPHGNKADCIELCLDTDNCKFVSISENDGNCFLFNQTCNTFVRNSSYLTVNVRCINPEPVQNFTQTCHNCGMSADCPPSFSQTKKYAEYQCNDLWNAFQFATSVMYDVSDRNCLAYDCRLVTQSIGNTVYRRTNISECLELELFVYINHEPLSCHNDLQTIDDVTSHEQCIGPCLDLNGCLGVTFYNGTCKLHGFCENTVFNYNTVYVKVACQEYAPLTCNRSALHRCEHCVNDFGCGSGEFMGNVYKFDEVNMDLFTNYPDAFMISVNSNESFITNPRCLGVSRLSGSVVFRKGCTSDCPHYEMFVTRESVGTCTVMDVMSGGMTATYCFQLCLDMMDCRAITFDSAYENCTFHNCSDSTNSSDRFTFIERKCLTSKDFCSRNYTQTCYNCGRSSNCLDYLTEIGELSFAENCSIQDNTTNGLMYYYLKYSACLEFNCSLVTTTFNSVTSRRACRQDCPRHRVFVIHGHEGTCDVISQTAGVDNNDYCLSQCLDMPGCLGISTYKGSCRFHSCNNNTANSKSDTYTLNGYTIYYYNYFYKIECYTSDYGCDNLYIQTCRNCKLDTNCQKAISASNTQNKTECSPDVVTNILPNSLEYNTTYARCSLANCSSVQQAMFTELYRPSCSSDCPFYRIYFLTGYIGTCDIIDVDEGGMELDFCVQRCLNMTYCRAVTIFLSQGGKCTYHNCTDRSIVEDGSVQFMKRVCENATEAVKPYLQTCVDCQVTCSHIPATLVNTTVDVKKQTECDATVYPNNAVVYSPQRMACKYFSCDMPVFNGPGTTLVRKTLSEDCPKFRMAYVRVGTVSCDVLSYVEGFTSKFYCARLCMDTPLCRLAVLPSIYDKNCTLYNCPRFTSGNKLAIWRQCEESCSQTTLQTCHNCEAGPECQEPFHLSANKESAETKPGGEGFTLSGDKYPVYQCNEVKQNNTSTFWRHTCSTDCPVYMMYTLANYDGMCEVMRIEHRMYYAYLCFDKCLDLPGCRAVTYKNSQCHYHTCDCALPLSVTNSASQSTFLWRYCISGNTAGDPFNTYMATNFCIPTTTTSTTTTTITLPISTNKVPSKIPKPIYLRPCNCSTGIFKNFTSEEIAKQFVRNLTINSQKLSSTNRKLTSAEDDRVSSTRIGTIGAAVIGTICGIFFLLDVRQIFRHLLFLPY